MDQQQQQCSSSYNAYQQSNDSKPTNGTTASVAAATSTNSKPSSAFKSTRHWQLKQLPTHLEPISKAPHNMLPSQQQSVQGSIFGKQQQEQTTSVDKRIFVKESKTQPISNQGDIKNNQSHGQTSAPINYQKIRQILAKRPAGNVVNSENQTQSNNAPVNNILLDDDLAQNGHLQVQKRATEPKCRTCEGMKDFVVSLQGEVKRLQAYTKDLQKQLIQVGGMPEPLNLNQAIKRFQNICPACSKHKQQQRPGSANTKVSSNNNQTRSNQQNVNIGEEFRIRKQGGVFAQNAAENSNNVRSPGVNQSTRSDSMTGSAKPQVSKRNVSQIQLAPLVVQRAPPK